MAADETESGSALPTPDRVELERVAFARPTSEADSAAAAEALRRLVEADAAAAAQKPVTPRPSASAPSVARAHPAAHTTADDDPADEQLEDLDGDYPIHRARRRVPALLVTLIAVGLVVGAGAGVALTSANPQLFAGGPGSTPVPTPSPSASTKADALAALAALGGAQSAKDKFPLHGFAVTLNLDPASTHQIFTSADGNTIWIGRASTDICLLFTGVDKTAGSTCATPLAFDEDGLTLGDGTNKYTSNGTDYSTTLNK